MKFLDLPTLARCDRGASQPAERDGGVRASLTAGPVTPESRLNSFLDSVDVGDLIVRGDLEAYSCARGAGEQAGAGAATAVLVELRRWR